MESIIQDLQKRISDAEKRVNDAGVALQVADKAYHAAINELHVWRAALDAESRAMQGSQGILAGMEDIVPPASVPAGADDSVGAVEVDRTQTGGTNKTELIRSLLRQTPAGLTPPQIWERVASEFKHRPYLYSVLKRLKDHDEVVIRRNKYMLRTSEEVPQQPMVQ